MLAVVLRPWRCIVKLLASFIALRYALRECWVKKCQKCSAFHYPLLRYNEQFLSLSSGYHTLSCVICNSETFIGSIALHFTFMANQDPATMRLWRSDLALLADLV